MEFDPTIQGIIPRLLSEARNNTVDSYGRGVLYRAAGMEYSPTYTKLLKLLLDSGADPEAAQLPRLKPFNAVVRNGDLEAVELMVDHGVDPAKYANQLPLHKAAANPRVGVLEFLLCTGYFNLDQPDSAGQTALFKAVLAKNPEAIELLLNWGAQPNFIDAQGLTPLHHVDYDVDEKTTKCIEILLRHGADGAAVGEKGRTALHWAAWYGSSKYSPEYTKRLKLFLDHGAGSKLDHGLYQTFTAVVEFGDLEAVQLFLKHGVKLTKCEEDNMPIVTYSARNRRTEILEFLLSTGIFDLSKPDQTTYTALHVAAQARNVSAAEILLDAGAEVDAVNRDGFTPFLYAAWIAGVGEHESDSAKCIELLLARGADVNSKLPGNSLSSLHISLHGAVGWHLDLNDEIPDGAMHIISHANLLQSQGRFVDPGLFILKSQNKKCQDELEALKKESLGGTSSLYDLLSEKKRQFYCNRSDFMEKLQDPEYIRGVKDRFPIYGNRLVGIVEYQNLLEAAAEKLSGLVGLPRDCFHLIIEKIVTMLTRRDLRALSKL